jgi:antitoxin YefM
MEVRMKRLRVEQDIQPVSAFRSNAAGMIAQIQASKRALVLTQRGRSAAVVLDAAEYDRLIETLELLQDVHEARAEITSGKSVSEKKAEARLLGRSIR